MLDEKTNRVFIALLASRLEDVGLLRNCVNCLNFNPRDETCALAHARPPAVVIAHGCEQWEADIPF